MTANRNLTLASAKVLARYGLFRSIFGLAYKFRIRSHPWLKRHPFDTKYGTTTNGFVPGWLLGSGGASDTSITAYGGCQPSCLRHAISTIPHPDERVFVDLGCGKGRALIIASEFPFHSVVGIELDNGLATDAVRNAAIVRAGHPTRPPIEVTKGNVIDTDFPAGKLVFFLYHSFGLDLLAQVFERTRQRAIESGQDVFFIYENPVHGHFLNSAPNTERWDAKTVRCDRDELECALDESETIVVWRISSDISASRAIEPAEEIQIVKEGWRAVLAMDHA